MDKLSPLKVEDLRALAMISEGLSMDSVAYLLGTSRAQVRYKLMRIERVLGFEVFYKARKKDGRPTYLTDAGKAFASKASEIIMLFDQAVEDVIRPSLPSYDRAAPS